MAALGVLVGEVVGHPRELDAGVVEPGDADLVVARRVADPDLAGLEQLLLPREDLLDKGVGDHGKRWEE